MIPYPSRRPVLPKYSPGAWFIPFCRIFSEGNKWVYLDYICFIYGIVSFSIVYMYVCCTGGYLFWLYN